MIFLCIFYKSFEQWRDEIRKAYDWKCARSESADESVAIAKMRQL